MPEKILLNVRGMTCSSCAQGINRHLAKKGLPDTLVSFESGEVEAPLITGWDAGRLISEINSLGYEASLPGKTEDKPTWIQKINSLEFRFAVSAAFTLPLLLHMFVGWHLLHLPLVQFLLSLPVMWIGWSHFGKSAWGSVKALAPNMDVLITLGSSSAFFYSLAGWLFVKEGHTGHYLFFETAATIITLLLLGNLIERKSLERTQSALEDLTRTLPQEALRITNPMTTGESTTTIPASSLQPNDLVLVNAGTRIPADGLIYWGYATVDESMMTGESVPAEKKENDKVIAGSVIQSGTIKIIVEQAGEKTILSQMVQSIRQSVLRKPAIQRTGDRLSAWFVPIVILIALGTLAYWLFAGLDSGDALMRAVAVLVISCPCAMGLATPTAVAVAIGRASSMGAVIKGGDTLERLASIDTIVLDKTGTITRGEPAISRIAYYADEEYCRYLLGKLEKYSTHPYARCLARQFENTSYKDAPSFQAITEIPGEGILATTLTGEEIKVGRTTASTPAKGAQVSLTIDNRLLAEVWFEDPVRDDARRTFAYFKLKGIKTVIISGDSPQRCAETGRYVGADEVYGGKLPLQKTEMVSALQVSRKVAMVGDGINDAPALANALVGIAMGSGTPLAMQTAEAVILHKAEPLHTIAASHQLSLITLKTIRQNLFWALIYNVGAIPLAAAGYLSPMLASLSMAFSDVVVIGNSLRIRFRKIEAGEKG